ncbi:MAG: DegV family protein [Clostridia bacterium]|nr:DegV family protein [Clostridia bacterium]
MKIAISTESTCDLSQEQVDSNDIKIIPYTVILGDEMVTDNADVPAKIFKFVEETKVLPKTSAINEATYKEYFEELLKSYDAVVHISLSSGLSSSCAHAESTADGLKNVYVIDSKSLSTGIGLLALYAKKLADAGEDAETIYNKVKARVESVQASFVVEKLDYLYKGGRCSALSLFGANLLKIRPQLVLKEGFIKPAKKYRGKMEKVIADYCKDTLEEFNTPDKSIGFITYTTATPEMIAAAKTALQNAGFETIVETVAGGTITSHCGEHVLGILYLNDGDKQ